DDRDDEEEDGESRELAPKSSGQCAVYEPAEELRHEELKTGRGQKQNGHQRRQAPLRCQVASQQREHRGSAPLALVGCDRSGGHVTSWVVRSRRACLSPARAVHEEPAGLVLVALGRVRTSRIIW